MNAIKHKDMELIMVLINAGAKVNKQGIWTYTALMYAIQHGGEHAVQSCVRSSKRKQM